MKISTVFRGDLPVVCLDISGRLFDVLKVHELVLDIDSGNKLSEFNVPNRFSLNFLEMDNVHTFLQLVEEFLLSSSGKVGELEDAVIAEGTFSYSSPVAECPMFFGVIQNSPEFWRRNIRDRIDLMFLSGFARSQSARTGHMNVIDIPSYSTSFRCAAELGVVIGKGGKDIPEEKAFDHVFGYTCVNDMIANCWGKFAAERNPDKQPTHFERLVNSYYGRCTENFGPVGPHIVTKDEVPDPYNLIMLTRQSGLVRDRSFTNAMLIGIERAISLLSRYIPLQAGSIIHMGSMGVDGITVSGSEPLTESDYIEIDIEHVGTLRNYFNDHRFKEQK